MTSFLSHLWSRRNWLAHNTRTAVTASVSGAVASSWCRTGRYTPVSARTAARGAAQAQQIDPQAAEALAQRTVEAARAAGATYADARLTRIVYHHYHMTGSGHFEIDDETLGVGVRVLVNGYWGFAASPYWEVDEVVQLARDAVAQAKDNMVGTPRTVEFDHVPVATGRWSTPLRIDPFTVPIEEKLDFIDYLKAEAALVGLGFASYGLPSELTFARQERVIANSEGSVFTQTLYESGGTVIVQFGSRGTASVARIETAGQGWERLLDAKIPEQFSQIAQDLARQNVPKPKDAEVGRYTIVCDGATMGALVNRTWGVATQLDRALGYEANASGTSILTDPLAMVGQLRVASPMVNITANRSAPTQLATVKWDDEGVVPEDFALVHDGVLVDFQTTREQATWLAPYYQRRQHAVRSHGCAGAESGLAITMQHMPNLALEPNPTGPTFQELVANVTNGLLIEKGTVETDFQIAGGTLWGTMHEIKNGRIGRPIVGGAVDFNTLDLWKNVTAVASVTSRVIQPESQYGLVNSDLASYKGQPGQATSHSYSAVAATITNQPLIIPTRKA